MRTNVISLCQTTIKPTSFRIIAERRILILGNSGNGKSASGNTIIGQNLFESRASNRSVTKKCQFHIMQDNGKQLLVVDTPALFSSSMGEDESMWELSKIIGITYPGFHAIIVVVKIGRFTEQEKNAFKSIETIFGSNVFNRIIVLFTGLDNLEADGMQFDDYVSFHIRSELKHIITKCPSGVVGFNNRADGKTRNLQAKDLLNTVEFVFQSNKQYPPIFCSLGLDRPESFFQREIQQRQKINRSKSTDELRNEIRREIENEYENARSMLSLLREDLMKKYTHTNDDSEESGWQHVSRYCPFCNIL